MDRRRPNCRGMMLRGQGGQAGHGGWRGRGACRKRRGERHTGDSRLAAFAPETLPTSGAPPWKPRRFRRLRPPIRSPRRPQRRPSWWRNSRRDRKPGHRRRNRQGRAARQGTGAGDDQRAAEDRRAAGIAVAAGKGQASAPGKRQPVAAAALADRAGNRQAGSARRRHVQVVAQYDRGVDRRGPAGDRNRGGAAAVGQLQPIAVAAAKEIAAARAGLKTRLLRFARRPA